MRPGIRNGTMATNDAARHGLYAQLEHVLGHDHADTLMSYLPRDRNDEVATKSDIARLERRMDERFAAMERRFDRMDDRMDRMQRFYVGTTVGSMTALTAMFALVVAFFG